MFTKYEADLLCPNMSYISTKGRGVRVSLPLLGDGQLIFRSVFPPIVSFKARPKFKTTLNFIFNASRTISLEPLDPQKWFTYQNLQFFFKRKFAEKPLKWCDQILLLENCKEQYIHPKLCGAISKVQRKCGGHFKGSEKVSNKFLIYCSRPIEHFHTRLKK